MGVAVVDEPERCKEQGDKRDAGRLRREAKACQVVEICPQNAASALRSKNRSRWMSDAEAIRGLQRRDQDAGEVVVEQRDVVRQCRCQCLLTCSSPLPVASLQWPRDAELNSLQSVRLHLQPE